MNPDPYRGFTRLTRISAILGISFAYAGNWQLIYAAATAYVVLLAIGIVHDEAPPDVFDRAADQLIKRIEK